MYRTTTLTSLQVSHCTGERCQLSTNLTFKENQLINQMLSPQSRLNAMDLQLSVFSLCYTLLWTAVYSPLHVFFPVSLSIFCSAFSEFSFQYGFYKSVISFNVPKIFCLSLFKIFHQLSFHSSMSRSSAFDCFCFHGTYFISQGLNLTF